jgi:hypothetical protein
MSDILGRLGATMALPDADVRFVVSLQTAIAGKLQQGNNPPPQGGAPPGPPGAGGPSSGPGAPPGLQMPGAPGPNGQGTQQPPMMGGLSAGLSPMGSANNPDEMRRVIQQMTG